MNWLNCMYINLFIQMDNADWLFYFHIKKRKKTCQYLFAMHNFPDIWSEQWGTFKSFIHKQFLELSYMTHKMCINKVHISFHTNAGLALCLFIESCHIILRYILHSHTNKILVFPSFMEKFETTNEEKVIHK